MKQPKSWTALGLIVVAFCGFVALALLTGCSGTNRRGTTYSQRTAYAPSAYAVPPRPTPTVPYGSADVAGGVVLTTDVAGNLTIRTPGGVRVLECYDDAGICWIR